MSDLVPTRKSSTRSIGSSTKRALFSRLHHRATRNSQCTQNTTTTNESRTSSFETSRISETEHTAISSPPSIESFEWKPHTIQSLERPMLRAVVEIQPEHKQVHADRRQTQWVGIKISGHVVCQQDLGIASPLDVGLILDNSAYASNYSLQRSKDLGLQIVKLLANPHDRLTIHTTCDGSPRSEGHGLQLLPFGCFNAVEVEGRLKSLNDRRCLISPNIQDLRGALLATMREFESKAGHLVGSKLARNRVVFVLSSNPAECILDCVLDFELHVINTGIIPWSRTRLPEMETGWQLSTSHLIRSKDSCIHELSELVRYARRQDPVGQISDVVVDVVGSPSCRVEQVFGNRFHGILQGGQTIALLAEIRLIPWYTYEHFEGMCSSEKAFAKVEYELDHAFSELTVNVTYHHSLFPSNTSIDVQEPFLIKRPNVKSKWSCRSQSDQGSDHSPDIDIERYFLHCVSTHYPAKKALNILSSKRFSKEHYFDAKSRKKLGKLEELRKLVKNELEYRMIVGERYSIYEHESQDVLNNQTQQGWPRSLGSEGIAPISRDEFASTPGGASTGSDATTVHHEREKDDVSPGQAREIWRAMRRVSTADHDVSHGQSPTLDKLTQDQMDLKARALRNKRSLGEASVVSFYKDALPRSIHNGHSYSGPGTS